MLDALQQKTFDILAADARLFRGGTAFAAGWTGAARVLSDADWKPGFVNLCDETYTQDTGGRRPAVYLGSRGMEASDKLDFPTISLGAKVEYRVAMIPLIVAVQAPTMREARRQRNQLRANIKQIFLDNHRADGYWYELTIPGESGGGAAREHIWTSATGAGGLQVAEAMATIPLIIRYLWTTTARA